MWKRPFLIIRVTFPDITSAYYFLLYFPYFVGSLLSHDVSCGVQGGTSCVRRSMEKRTPVVCSTVFNVMMVSEEKVLKLETLIRWKPQIRPSWKSSENPWGVLFWRDPCRPGPANSSLLAYRYSAGSVSFMGDVSSETESISTPWMTTVLGTGFRVFIICLAICSSFRNGRNTEFNKKFIFFYTRVGFLNSKL